MKTSTLRNAISIALLVATIGPGERAMAPDTTKDTAAQGRAPVTDAPAGKHSKKSANTSTAPVATNLQAVTVTGTRIRGGTTPSPVITIGSEQIQQEGFTERADKRRILRAKHQQRVTGLVVNERVNIPRADRRKFRAILHNCAKHGVASQAKGKDDF